MSGLMSPIAVIVLISHIGHTIRVILVVEVEISRQERIPEFNRIPTTKLALHQIPFNLEREQLKEEWQELM